MYSKTSRLPIESSSPPPLLNTRDMMLPLKTIAHTCCYPTACFPTSPTHVNDTTFRSVNIALTERPVHKIYNPIVALPSMKQNIKRYIF